MVLLLVVVPPVTRAQVRPITLAEGYEANIFASPDNVPEFASGAFAGPTVMAFDARGRLFVGTGSGKILILLDTDDDGRADQVKTFATGVPLPLGMAFRSNGDLFVASNINGGAGRIIRLRDTNGDDVADEQTVILDNLPSNGDHQTDKIKFGPDGRLYIGQGSATDNGTPNPPGRPAEGPFNGAILNIDVDNPEVNVFATGIRQPFGLAFHPDNGALFSVDIGQGEFCNFCVDDPAPPEEINWVVAGGNYGFPLCDGSPTMGNPNCAGVRAPLLQYPPHLTPTGLSFYTGPQANEFKNQLLVAIYKNYHNLQGYGGDLRRVVVDGNPTSGFALRDDGFLIQVNPIDPGDGPVDDGIDPISGDVYLVRFDPVSHSNPTEHHHFIYRVHRTGSDTLPFIGPPQPAAIKAGSAGATISLIGRHLKSGAAVVDQTDNTTLTTRLGADRFELLADLPASLLASERTITLAVRNPDGGVSNTQTFSVTKGDPNPPPDKIPQITSEFVYKKKRANVFQLIPAGSNPKKFRLVVDGTDFDSAAQLLVGGTPLTIESRSTTELVGLFTRDMLAAPAVLSVQVKNSNGKISNAVTVMVVVSLGGSQ